MTTSMTWVRDPRSTFKLPTFDKPDQTELVQTCRVTYVRFGSKADIGLRPVESALPPKADVLGTCVVTDKIGFVL
jgi:hypothetical protein